MRMRIETIVYTYHTYIYQRIAFDIKVPIVLCNTKCYKPISETDTGMPSFGRHAGICTIHIYIHMLLVPTAQHTF